MKHIRSAFPSLFLFLFSFFHFLSSGATGLKAGSWVGILQLNDSTELPFNFEVSNAGGKTSLVIINAEEHIQVDEISLLKDSVFIKMPVFDSEFKCKNYGDSLKGKWINHARKEKNILRFKAYYGKTHRFERKTEPPFFEVKGRYEVTFSPGKPDSSKAVLIIGLSSTQTIGTFLTETGDYRYLEGILPYPEIYLSCFDGSHAFLFKGKFVDGNIYGDFYSGAHGYESWYATENNLFELRNPCSLAYMKPDSDRISFSFPNMERKTVSLSDEKFKNKVVIVQIMGSWCPNCMDETKFFAQLYNQYRSRGLEIEGIAFERTEDFEKARSNLTRMKTQLGAEYEFLITGKSGSKAASEAFPMLNQVIAFPTTIFIDKKGEVRRVYTGISGPATGNYYEQWKKETTDLIMQLLAE